MQVNPEITKIIDDIDPSENFPLYRVRYSYGDLIVDKGKFNLPSADGEMIAIDDPLISNLLQEDLGYPDNGQPSGIVLKNSIQESLVCGEELLPLSVAKAGSICALWHELDIVMSYYPIKIFSVTAGANAIYMLPNIGNHLKHKKLKSRYNFMETTPKSLQEHWSLFKSIAKYSARNGDGWEVEMLFFSKHWITKVKQALKNKKDSSWLALYTFFIERVWKSSAVERNQIFYDYALSLAQRQKHLKPNPYLTDTAKYLLLIGLGVAVGFGAAVDEELCPTSTIQQAYLESYHLESAPIILVPKHFSLLDELDNSPVYYSLQMPTTFFFSPKSRKLSTTLEDLDEIKHILNTFLAEIRKKNLGVEGTVMETLANNVKFEYFHTKPEMNEDIQYAGNIPNLDQDIQYVLNKFQPHGFPYTGSFSRGCIRLTKNNKINDDEDKATEPTV